MGKSYALDKTSHIPKTYVDRRMDIFLLRWPVPEDIAPEHTVIPPFDRSPN